MLTLKGVRDLDSATFWRWNLLAWLAFGVLGFIVRWIAHGDWEQALALTFVQEPFAFFLSGLLWVFFRRPALSDPFHVASACWMLGLTFIAALLQSWIVALIVNVTGWKNAGWTETEEWLFRLTFVWLLYMVWSLGFFWLKARTIAESEKFRATAALEDAQRIELQLLRAQLDPHFLFNSLNSVAAEIPAHPDAALEMVHELSAYLRYSLDHRDRMVAPLAWELDAVTAYLRIEQIRFGDRMSATVEAEVDARGRMVPTFLLQPIVENAVKHGQHADRSEIHIFAGCNATTLRIEVQNRGKLPDNLEVVEGVGLETLRRRLELHYPGRAHFELSQMDGMVFAELELEGEPCCV